VDETGSAYCMTCKVGQFSINPGQPKCQECERGKFKSSLGDKSLVCSLCPAGFSQNFASQGTLCWKIKNATSQFSVI
jgi:hypothetical protein